MIGTKHIILAHELKLNRELVFTQTMKNWDDIKHMGTEIFF